MKLTDYPTGATPLEPEDLEKLIPDLATRAELNAAEQANILRALLWARGNRMLRRELRGVCFRVLAVGISATLAAEPDSMRIVQQAIADRIGQGGVADVVVPALDRQLCADDGRALRVAILDDLEQVAALRLVERHEAEVVDLCGAPHKSTHVEHLLM